MIGFRWNRRPDVRLKYLVRAGEHCHDHGPPSMPGLAKAVYDELVGKGRDVVTSVSGTATKGFAIRTSGAL